MRDNVSNLVQTNIHVHFTTEPGTISDPTKHFLSMAGEERPFSDEFKPGIQTSSTQPQARIGGLEPAPGTPRAVRALLATAAAGDDSRQQRPAVLGAPGTADTV